MQSQVYGMSNWFKKHTTRLNKKITSLQRWWNGSGKFNALESSLRKKNSDYGNNGDGKKKFIFNFFKSKRKIVVDVDRKIEEVLHPSLVQISFNNREKKMMHVAQSFFDIHPKYLPGGSYYIKVEDALAEIVRYAYDNDNNGSHVIEQKHDLTEIVMYKGRYLESVSGTIFDINKHGIFKKFTPYIVLIKYGGQVIAKMLVATSQFTLSNIVLAYDGDDNKQWGFYNKITKKWNCDIKKVYTKQPLGLRILSSTINIPYPKYINFKNPQVYDSLQLLCNDGIAKIYEFLVNHFNDKGVSFLDTNIYGQKDQKIIKVDNTSHFLFEYLAEKYVKNL